MNVRIPVRQRGQLTLPAKIRKSFHIEDGDILEAEVTEEGILIRPKKLVDSEQTWFWSKEWQSGEHAAEKDIREGKVKTHRSVDEMLEDLKS